MSEATAQQDAPAAAANAGGPGGDAGRSRGGNRGQGGRGEGNGRGRGGPGGRRGQNGPQRRTTKKCFASADATKSSKVVSARALPRSSSLVWQRQNRLCPRQSQAGAIVHEKAFESERDMRNFPIIMHHSTRS